MRDIDGNRLKKQLFTIDGACVARIDVLTRGGKRVSSFYAKGQGTSPNRESITSDLKDDALNLAVRYAAVSAADRITPRRVRESILLDERSPAFADALAMIEADRLSDARTTLEAQLQRNPRSAPLRYNLGAIYEALGDRVAARKHYIAAKVLAPEEPRYAAEMKRFVARGD